MFLRAMLVGITYFQIMWKMKQDKSLFDSRAREILSQKWKWLFTVVPRKLLIALSHFSSLSSIHNAVKKNAFIYFFLFFYFIFGYTCSEFGESHFLKQNHGYGYTAGQGLKLLFPNAVMFCVMCLIVLRSCPPSPVPIVIHYFLINILLLVSPL